MTAAEILKEIPNLSREERDAIRRRLEELDDSLTPEEWSLIDQRIAGHEADPESAVPWEEFKTRLEITYGP